MPKLCINTRDELIFVYLDKVAYVQAEGNYTNFFYTSGAKQILCIGISRIEHLVAALYRPQPCPYVKIGRSLLVNQNYVHRVSLPTGKLVLSDLDHPSIGVNVSKNLLKSYKDYVAGKSQSSS